MSYFKNIAAAVLLILVGALLLFHPKRDAVLSWAFRLHDVTIAETAHLSRNQLLEAGGLAADAPWVWSLSLRELKERLEAEPWVDKATLELCYFPPRLAVNIAEVTPWLVAEFGRAKWLISRSGKFIEPLSRAPDADWHESALLPRLRFRTSTAFANESYRYVVQVLRAYEAAGGFPYQVKSYAVTPDGSIEVRAIESDRFPEVLLPAATQREAIEQFQRLAVVLGDLRKRNQPVRRVDLRFKDQVVVEPITGN